MYGRDHQRFAGCFRAAGVSPGAEANATKGDPHTGGSNGAVSDQPKHLRHLERPGHYQSVQPSPAVVLQVFGAYPGIGSKPGAIKKPATERLLGAGNFETFQNLK